jgi:hypothetical protein
MSHFEKFTMDFWKICDKNNIIWEIYQFIGIFPWKYRYSGKILMDIWRYEICL